MIDLSELMEPNEESDRFDLFVRWFGWSVAKGDCDPAIWMLNYIFDRMEFNTEQRYWICWLYANTYQLPTAWVIGNEFPDYENVGLERLTNWNNEKYKILRYQVDCKWSKGHLPTMFSSYHGVIGNMAQQEYFDQIYTSADANPSVAFDLAFNTIQEKFFKFGRYTSWFYLQALKHCCGFNINPSTLILDDYSGSKSHREGLYYALGRDDWVKNKAENRASHDPSFTDLEWLNREAANLLDETKLRYPALSNKLDYFSMETALCSFKKLFRKSRGRYLGYYLDRQAEEIQQVAADNWEGIEWSLLWQSREETLDKRLLTNKVQPELFSYFLDTGKLYNEEMI